jgi:hypothetical protein
MQTTQAVWSVLIAAAAVVVPAALGLYYFAAQQSRARATVSNALRNEIYRLKDVLEARLRWIDKPESREFPLLPFDTSLYDHQLDKIGMLDSRFAKWVVQFYGQLHFVNDMHAARPEYYQVADGQTSFFYTYGKAIRKAIGYIPPEDPPSRPRP